MPHEYIQPEALFESKSLGYSQVVKAQPGRTLFLSGQGAFDAGFRIIGEGDVGAQTSQALENVRAGLAAAGATVADLTSLRIYVVGFNSDHMGPIGAAIGSFFGDGDPPAQTLIGVQALGLPSMLVEIEATAVIGD
jgi:enamine deaminase RidA (YjgF/YER057c/UK114 family)